MPKDLYRFLQKCIRVGQEHVGWAKPVGKPVITAGLYLQWDYLKLCMNNLKPGA